MPGGRKVAPCMQLVDDLAVIEHALRNGGSRPCRRRAVEVGDLNQLRDGVTHGPSFCGFTTTLSTTN